MKHIVRITALLLSIALCFSLVACSSGDTSYILTNKNGLTVDSGVYALDLLSCYNDAVDELGDDYISSDLFLNVIDGMTFKDYVDNSTMVLCKNSAAVHDKFTELNLTLNEEDVESYQEAVDEAYDENTSYYDKYGISTDDMMYYQEALLMQDALFDYYYGEGGDEEISQDEIDSYLTDNYGLILTIASSTSASSDADTIEAQKEAMKEYVERLNSGESSFIEIAKEFYYYGFTESEIESIEESYGDSAPTFEESSYKQVVDITSPDENDLIKQIVETEAGTAFYYEDESSFRLVVVKNILLDEDTYSDYVEYAPYLLRGDDFTSKLNTWVEEYAYEINTATVKKFDIQKIVNDKFKL